MSIISLGVFDSLLLHKYNKNTIIKSIFIDKIHEKNLDNCLYSNEDEK